VYFALCLIVVPLPPGKNSFAVQLNNNNINSNNNIIIISIIILGRRAKTDCG
jgi:hypothetical protein